MLQKVKKLVPRRLVNQYHHVLAWLGAVWYGWPSNKLVVIGVTGTSGKSTTVLLIAKILEEAGFKVGYTSTIGFKVDKEEWFNEHKVTMLGWFFNQRLLSRMVKAGCQYAIVESASQGVLQYRHVGINYDVMLFTNIHEEHLEAHGGFENYRAAKGQLFRHLTRYKRKEFKKLEIRNWKLGNLNSVETPHSEIYERQNETDVQENSDTSNEGNGSSNLQGHDQKKYIPKQIVVNLDDGEAEYFAGFEADHKYGFGVQGYKGTNNFQFPISNFQKNLKSQIPDSNIFGVTNVKLDGRGSSFLVGDTKFKIHLFGEYNVYNSVAAITAAWAVGVDMETCAKGLEKVKAITGHMEEIENDKGFRVFVDYAFEPKALEKSYEVVKNLIKTEGKIIHVLGACGGGRDKGKRPVMGRMAAENTNVVIVTNEDPYDEDPTSIINEVYAGAEREIRNKKLEIGSLYKILDRREAIKKALELAGEGDLVFITGKGCEQFICVENGKKVDWDDRVVIREELGRLK